MFDPMLARLAGCFVFAGLLGALVVAASTPQPTKPSDVVTKAEIQQRMASYEFTRP